MIARLLICSDINEIKNELQKTIASHLTSGNVNHPDILYFETGSKLGITESRKIKDHFSLKPYSAKGRAVVLEDASEMTTEAQNALLKTLEELPKQALLLLGAGSDANFLPTILSRCQVIHLKTDNKLNSVKYAEDLNKLLNSSLEERFGYVEKLKDKDGFLHASVRYFRQHLSDYPEFTARLLQAEEWARQNVNMRAILEYLMLIMPSAK